MQPAGGRVFTGRLESRNEGAARERNVVGFDFGGVEVAQEECKVGQHREKEMSISLVLVSETRTVHNQFPAITQTEKMVDRTAKTRGREQFQCTD